MVDNNWSVVVDDNWLVVVDDNWLMTYEYRWLVITGWWLSQTLKHMSSSVGITNFPTEWTNESHAPNHQPD